MEKVGNLLREKILIVDDNRFHRAMTADILARVGYATVQVDNSTKALARVPVESPDLVIFDSLLPESDGSEVCRKLKGDPFTNHIPILIFTANTSVLDKVNSLRIGADGYLLKPFASEELVAHVQTLLRRSFHYDPLTKLPAAPYLHRQIDARLAQNMPTAILYADIDHFRPFNQAYGHDAGDKVLVQTAKLMIESLPARDAFVGHLGSDDYIAVLSPDGANTVAQTMIDRFRMLQSQFYNDTDYKRGSVFVQDQQGQAVEFPLMTLSVAIITNIERALINYVQVSELLSKVMGHVKAQGGGRWARDRRAN